MHNKFAYIYDEFTKSVEYNSWYKFLRKYIKKKGKLLDIGCGTGTLSKKFADDGFDVTGVDISSSMIEISKKKDEKSKYEVLDIEKDDINEKYEYITCNFDTVNYLKSIENFIIKCSSMQDENGILIFDVVSEEIFEEIFENDLFIDEEENYTAIWKYEKKAKNKHHIDITVFAKKEGELYEKFIESHDKYIYDVEYIVEKLNENGYYLYDLAKNPKYGESRFFIIAKK